jgi:membrane protein YqaA with SNARE-associated domain
MSTSWLCESNPEVLRQIKALVQSYGYTGVFISTIIAGSIIPLGSPIIVGSAVAFGLNITSLALIAATGYTLGASISYVLAWLLGESYVKNKIGEETFQRYAKIWNKYGYKLSALFSFIPRFPIDLLAFVCGCLRTKAKFFIPICWLALLIQFLLCGLIGQFLGLYIFQ